MDEAKSRGWTLTIHSDHSWGALFCPTGECKITILSTARGGESFAKRALRLVKRCPHLVESQTLVDARVRDHLEAGERFTDATERLAERDGYTEEAEEMLRLADHAVTSAELEREFDVAAEQGVALGGEAQALLAGTRLEGESETTVVLAAADRETTEAEAGLEGVVRTNDEVGLEALRGRAGRLRERVDDLKRELGFPDAEL